MESTRQSFSVVVPVYKCAETLRELCARLSSVFAKLSVDFEIILVNDGSPANDWEIICALAAEDKRIKSINLSRNFGQHNAIMAGIRHASCDWTVVMDGDLQDVPEEIPALYEKALSGYDVVFARRVARQDGAIKRLTSALFHGLVGFLSGVPSDSTIGNFSLSSRKVREAFLGIREHTLGYSFILRWLGFRSASVDVQHCARKQGETSYTVFKSLTLASSIILSHSNKPLWISIAVGGLCSAISGVYGLFLVLHYFLTQVPVTGWTSLMVSLYFLSGLLLMQLGVIGLYIGKIFDEAKNRPLYVVDETLNIAARP